MSDCLKKVSVINNTTCKVIGNGKNESVDCENILSNVNHTSEAVVWVCGGISRHSLPKRWSGCCYPAILSTMSEAYRSRVAIASAAVHQMSKRELGVPSEFEGYRMWDPWTETTAGVAWSIIPQFGVTAALKKLNGLAWQVQILSNETQRGFHLIAEEMQGLYTAVYQNRLVLDIMTSEKGGICKMLNEKCCFNVPANHKNMTSVIEHMRNAIRPPPQRSDNGWFGDWTDWSLASWKEWLMGRVLPLVCVLFLIVLLIPCVINMLKQAVLTSLSGNRAVYDSFGMTISNPGVVPGEEEQAEGKLDDSSEEEWDPPFSNLHFESE